MKNRIVNKKQALICIVQLFCYTMAAQWTQVSSPSPADLNDVFFSSSQIGYAVGLNGAIIKTTDGGNSWNLTHNDTMLEFQSVHFTSDSIGYIGGGHTTNGAAMLLKTTNAGNSWTPVLADTGTIKRIYFVNDSLGFASTTNSKLYKTINAGNTWIQLGLNYSFRAIVFTNDSTGYFFSNGIYQPVFKTTNRGQSFFQVYPGWYTTAFESAYFLNDSIGYACAWYAATLAKTSDGGSTWSNLDSASAPDCSDVYFINENIGYYIKRGGGIYTIKGTIDGGNTWATQLSGSGVLNKFYFIDSLNAVVVGNNGIIYKTNNGGAININEADINDKYVNVYPNPVHDDIVVHLNSNEYLSEAIKIYSLLGQELLSIKPLSPQTIIDTRDLLPGIYFLRVVDANNSGAIHKIVKQ